MSNKIFKNIDDLIDYSINYDDETNYFDCDFFIKRNNKKVKVHGADVCHRDLILYTEKESINFVIDTIGFNNYLCEV